MLAGARALEKGLQVLDQDSIEEMALWLSSLVGTGRVVKVGCHDADGTATCVPSSTDRIHGPACTSAHRHLRCTKYSLLQKTDLAQDIIRTMHRTGTLWNIPEAGLFPMGHRVRTTTKQFIAYRGVSTGFPGFPTHHVASWSSVKPLIVIDLVFFPSDI